MLDVKNVIIRTGVDSNIAPPPELSSMRKQRFPGLKGTHFLSEVSYVYP